MHAFVITEFGEHHYKYPLQLVTHLHSELLSIHHRDLELLQVLAHTLVALSHLREEPSRLLEDLHDTPPFVRIQEKILHQVIS